MDVLPETIKPSTGIIFPGLTAQMSPLSTFSAGTTMFFSFFMISAVSGVRLIKALIALVVFPLLYDSNVLPIVIRVSIIAADSKYNPCNNSWADVGSPFSVKIQILTNNTTLYMNDMPLPIATRVSIFGARWITPLKPEMKNLQLIIIIVSERTNSTIPIASGVMKEGSGQFHIICPIETYINTSSITTEEINLIKSCFVVLLLISSFSTLLFLFIC